MHRFPQLSFNVSYGEEVDAKDLSFVGARFFVPARQKSSLKNDIHNLCHLEVHNSAPQTGDDFCAGANCRTRQLECILCLLLRAFPSELFGCD